jgi:hypothetical protein
LVYLNSGMPHLNSGMPHWMYWNSGMPQALLNIGVFE